MEEGLDAHLDGEQDAEEFVAAAVGGVGHGACEYVAQGEEALGQLVVGAVEVEEGEDDGLQRRGGRDGGEMRGEVVEEASLARLCLALLP